MQFLSQKLVKNEVKFWKFSGSNSVGGTGSGQKAGTAVGWGTGKIFATWGIPIPPGKIVWYMHLKANC